MGTTELGLGWPVEGVVVSACLFTPLLACKKKSGGWGMSTAHPPLRGVTMTTKGGVTLQLSL